MTTQSREIEMSVAWGKKDFGKRDLYRFGLVTNDEDVNLKAIFIETVVLIPHRATSAAAGAGAGGA